MKAIYGVVASLCLIGAVVGDVQWLYPPTAWLFYCGLTHKENEA